MARKSGLGRGLDALFASDNTTQINNGETMNATFLRLTLIEPKSDQPRKDFNKEALYELAESISKHGVIQPISVRKLENGYYQIIAGERRWRAAKIAGLNEIPVIVHDVDEYTAARMTLIENLQREDLNPIEEANGYKFLAENYNLTQEEIAKQVVKSRSVIANSMRLLALPDKVLTILEQGGITSGHARSLLAIDDEDDQITLAEKIRDNDLSVREVESIVKNRKTSTLKTVHVTDDDLYFKSIIRKMVDVLGTNINISKKMKGDIATGKLEITYEGNEQLEEFIKKLCGSDIFDEDMNLAGNLISSPKNYGSPETD